MNYEDAFSWLLNTGAKKPHLFLGNGFSMAYDSRRFSYAVLADKADKDHTIPPIARRLMAKLNTSDFEAVMRTLASTSATLALIDHVRHAALIAEIDGAVVQLREALARSIAGLHPNRPYEIDDKQYLATRTFLDRFAKIYTVNYDLLLYWSVMQDLGPEHRGRRNDDGFRDSGVAGDDTVLWNIYDSYAQDVYYLHGALHLFLGLDGLRKITWIRTADALIDQVRAQLAADRFPLYVAEGESAEKLDRINRSAYLSKGLRSLTSCAGGMMVYGHSLDQNDAHVLRAIVRSRIRRIAVSLYGSPTSALNKEVQRRARALVGDRTTFGGLPLEVDFYDAESVALWRNS